MHLTGRARARASVLALGLGLAAYGGLTACGGGGSGSSSGGGGGGGGGTSGPKLVQTNATQTQGNAFANDTSVQFNAATAAGDTIWVAVTVSDFAGVHTISVSDTQGNTYTPLDQENDGAPGTQSVAHFYASNIAGDTGTPDTVTVNWTSDNYKGAIIAEISGATHASLVGHSANTQDGLTAGTNNVSSGPVDVASAATPALLIALSMNTSGGTSDTGGSGATGPAAGTGLTQVGTYWDWGGNLATLATETRSGAGTAAASFNAPDTDSYVTVAAVFH
jgi:hypothetical protein